MADLGLIFSGSLAFIALIGLLVAGVRAVVKAGSWFGVVSDAIRAIAENTRATRELTRQVEGLAHTVTNIKEDVSEMKDRITRLERIK